jgi:hypothetical protein
VLLIFQILFLVMSVFLNFAEVCHLSNVYFSAFSKCQLTPVSENVKSYHSSVKISLKYFFLRYIVTCRALSVCLGSCPVYPSFNGQWWMIQLTLVWRQNIYYISKVQLDSIYTNIIYTCLVFNIMEIQVAIYTYIYLHLPGDGYLRPTYWHL